MDFHELVRVRHSVRAYKPDAPAEDQIFRVLSAAVAAPTAANLQPWTFIVVTEAETREKFKSIYNRDWFCQAPVIVVGCVEPKTAWRRSDGFSSAEIDLAIAMDHLILAATEEGLGTCWVCAFDEEKTKSLLKIPPEVRVLAMTPLGYPSDSHQRQPAQRKRMADLVRRGRW